MKLYLAPGACSLADHIALHEAGLEFDRIRVDLRTKRTESGDDFHAVLRRQLTETPRAAGEVNPQLSPFFEELVRTLLAKEPAQRFASAADLLAALADGERSSWWSERAARVRARSRPPGTPPAGRSAARSCRPRPGGRSSSCGGPRSSRSPSARGAARRAGRARC